MQRKATASESRLKNNFTLGIGGHIRQEDIVGKSIDEWATREFHEEVDYSGSLTITPLGILNDESNDVGRVHTGFVFLLHGDSNNIAVKEELKQGRLVTLEEAANVYERMESWSKMCFDFLKVHAARYLK